jgi:predicted transposase YbfD/YdcC
MQSEKEFLQGFEECFGAIKDKRQKSKIDYPLIEILFLTVVAVAGGAFSWGMIEGFGKAHLKLLKSYYPFKNGAPSDDTIRRVFETIDPENMNEVLQNYFTQDLNLDGKHVAIDGKTLRGSRRNGVRALHMLNVYASGSGLTLFGKTVEAKTNEITAIPEALDLLDLKGSTITIDAMGCQRNIAQQIINKEADYILGLKENQASLYNEVEKAFSAKADGFFGIDKDISEDKGHGRICKRTCRVMNDLSKLPLASLWPGAVSVIEIKSETITKGVTTYSTNYYIASGKNNPATMMKNIRDHWKIESMHWMLDVVFKEDASSMNKGNVPANMAIIRRFILNILTNMKGKRESRPMLMKMIGWSPDYLYRFINLLLNRS